MAPGISGATMAVCFGIYERLVDDVAHLRHSLKEDSTFIVTVFFGFAVGVFLSAKFLNNLMDGNISAAMFLFVGLILGQLPAVIRMAFLDTRKDTLQKPNLNDILAITTGLAIMAVMGIMSLVENTSDVNIGHDATSVLIMVGIGIIVALSALTPGVSHSTVLLVFGLFSAFTAAISNVDVYLLIPMSIGAVAGVMLFSKAISDAIGYHRRISYMVITGLTAGSAICVAGSAVTYISNIDDIIVGTITFMIGLAAGLLFLRLDTQNADDEENITEIYHNED